MNKTYIYLIAFLCSLLPGCTGDQSPANCSKQNDVIIESNSITDITKYLDPSDYSSNTLVVFDIDNTLGRPPTDLGSDQWFYANIERLKKEGKNFQEAVKHLVPIYLQIHQHTQMVPVENETVPLVRELQKKGITVIALTARSISLTNRTAAQLQQMGIDFSLNLPYKFPIVYEPENGQPAIYLGGIIFVGNHDKGEVLVHWLEQTGISPHKVIFVDDKMKNIRSVEKALCKQHYPFIGIRYSRLDERVKNFNVWQADKELEQFIEAHPESRPVPLT